MKRGALTALGAVIVVGLAHGQENLLRPLPGTKQLGISGNYMTGGGTHYRVQISGGYYLTESIIGVVKVNLAQNSPSRSSASAGLRFQLPISGITIPYVFTEAEFIHSHLRQPTSPPSSRAIITNPDTPTSNAYRFGLGTDIFLRRDTAIYLELSLFRGSFGNRTGTDLEMGLHIFFR